MMFDMHNQSSVNKPFVDELFMQDTLDLFCGTKTGHMNAYAFNEADPLIPNDPVRGGEYWAQMIEKAPAYYLVKQESEVIQAFAPEVGHYLPSGLTSVDLGPGETEAVLKKTIPFNNNLVDLRDFISVDINNHFSHQACRLVGQALRIPATSITGNFFAEELDLPVENRTVATLFGGLLCNAPHSDLLPGYKHVQESFRGLSHNFKSGDYLVVTQDTNQDKKVLLDAYNHPLMGQYILSVLYKIKRDLPTENFDPSCYEFVVKWDEQENLLSLNARLADGCAPQSFKIGAVPFTVGRNKLIPLVNSYKFPVSRFIEAAQASGFISRKKYKLPGNPICVHVFEYDPVRYLDN